jgi:hypothetical protein
MKLLGEALLQENVLKTKPFKWDSLTTKDTFSILQKCLHDKDSVLETFTTRDVCMKWVCGMSTLGESTVMKKQKRCKKKKIFLIN